MQRIVYLCPADDMPVGGVKIIYRHVEALNRMGLPAFVLHPTDPTFRCGWFRHDVPFLADLTLNATSDFVVIPDVWTLLFGLQCQAHNLRYAIFVQNGYLMYPLQDEGSALLTKTVCNADLVLSISHDTDLVLQLNFPALDPARLVRVSFAIPECFIATGRQAATGGTVRRITFMPRKLPAHSGRVVYALRHYLPPGWDIQAIDSVDEATCAAMLGSSRIFLSFSEFEGLPLPPLEAALAGNLVIGYTGRGGAESWVFPNFHAVEQGNIIGFVRAAQSAAAQMEVGLFGRDIMQPGIARLASRFSISVEAQSLRMLADRIAACLDARQSMRRGKADTWLMTTRPTDDRRELAT